MRSLYRSLFCRNVQHVVLGRRLRPFSNWHRAQLDFVKSPLLGHAGELGLPCLVVAVSVCVTRWPQTFLPPQDVFEYLLHRRALRAAKRDPLPALRAWGAYLRGHMALPAMFKKSAGKLCQCPAPLATWAALVNSGGFTKAEAWDEPCGEAAWEKIALAEAGGAELNLLTEKARAAMLKAGWGKVMPELLEGDEPA